MTTLGKIILSACVAFGVAAISTSTLAQDSSDRRAAESAASVVAQLELDVRFTALEPNAQGCREAINGKKCERFYLIRDEYLVAETRWLYCMGRIDHLPTWAR